MTPRPTPSSSTHPATAMRPPRREEEALWCCRHFGRHFRISVAEVVRLFDLVGLRTLDRRPTALAKFLELTHAKRVYDPRVGPCVLHGWYRDRTLRFIAKQPATRSFFAARARRAQSLAE